MTDITSVTVVFGNGIKREEYGPLKKAEVSITASVAENEDGNKILSEVGALAMLKVAEMLDAPKPDTVSSKSIQAANAEPQEKPSVGEPPKRRGRPPKNPPADTGTPPEIDTNSATSQTATEPEAVPADTSADDEWAAASDDIQITDQEILAATSKRAQELGAREPIVKLIATFATRTEGAPFKVQEIPQNQRKDYLEKLSALTA